MDYYDPTKPEPRLSEVYASPDGHDLIADIYLPEPTQRHGAAVLFVHGGGWNAGSRHQFRWHAHRLSLHGYVACTVSYRLATIAPFPAALDDCQAAVRWLRAQAARFQLDPARVGAVGSSAGGHLVACLGVFDHPVGGISSRVDCVVDIHGVHDFPRLNHGDAVKTNRIEFLGGTLEEKPDAWKQASPALHVDASSAPTLLTHDPHETTVPYEQSVIFANALIQHARPVQFLPTPGSGHGFAYSPANAWTQRIWPQAVAFLDHHLGVEATRPRLVTSPITCSQQQHS